MSDYRVSVSKGSKDGGSKRGQSASAKHSYHQRTNGYEVGRDGAREDLAASGSGHLPSWADGPANFWLASDSYERANGTLYRELQLNLPNELGLEQQQQIIEAYAERLFASERLPFSWAIHSPDGENPNPHAHLMVSESKTDDLPRTDEQHFKRYNPQKPGKGGVSKTRTLKLKGWLKDARLAWSEEANKELVAAGHQPRFDHRSKEEQRAEALRLGKLRRAAMLDTPTQRHEGPRISGMRRRLDLDECDKRFVTIESLPQYAQDIIRGNDAAREYSRQWREQVQQMSDGELQELFAAELNHGAHVATWLLDLHKAALVEDGERDAAKVELLHEAALVEDGERDAAKVELLHEAALVEDGEREWVAQTRALVIKLRPVATHRPTAAVKRFESLEDAVTNAATAKKSADAALAAESKPNFVKKTLGIKSLSALAVSAAQSAVSAAATEVRNSPDRKPVISWRSAQAELEAIQPQLLEMERRLGMEPMAEIDARALALIASATEKLEAADLHITEQQPATSEEQAALQGLRREIRKQLVEFYILRDFPPAPDAAALIDRCAGELLQQAIGWREAQDVASEAAARAAAAAEAQPLSYMDDRWEPQAGDDPEPAPSPRGPRLR